MRFLNCMYYIDVIKDIVAAQIILQQCSIWSKSSAKNVVNAKLALIKTNIYLFI